MRIQLRQQLRWSALAIGFLLNAVLVPAQSWAQASKSDSTAGKNEKVDISDIEQKYWAPKDTDFSVVQNRTYSKEKRFSFSALFGPIVNEGFSEGNALNLQGNYFFNERYGVQVDYMMPDFKDSDTTKNIKGLNGSPDYGIVQSYYGVGFNWVPFYAKMSVLGSRIIYFDMAFTPTLGMTTYDQQTFSLGAKSQSAFTYGFDITQLFFFSKHFAVRVDLKNRWFSEEIVRYRGSGVEGTKLRTESQDNTFFLIGATLFF